MHSKFIDLQLDQNRRSSAILDDTSLGNYILLLYYRQYVKVTLFYFKSQGLPSNDWLSQVNSNDLLSPSFLNNTPPSPSQLQPLSPYTLFEVPFADLNLSAPSSPEPNNPPPLLIEKINTSDSTKGPKTEATPMITSPPPPPPPAVPNLQVKERASCKRTLSRTRSTRKPSIKALSKKNRSQTQQPKSEEENLDATVKEELPLDHNKVMEALRAKLQRSTQQQKEQKNVKEEITSMSPSGILLLDLKNPKKSFPVRPKATPRASVVRKPNSFISAHKPKEQSL